MTFYHILKLFQPPSPDAPTITNPDGTIVPHPPVIDTKKRLVSEFYDEIVFNEPSQMMQQMLNTIQPVTNGPWIHDTDCKITVVQSCVRPIIKLFILIYSWGKEGEVTRAHSWDAKKSQDWDCTIEGEAPADERQDRWVQRFSRHPQSSAMK